jgi:hypothetical protein
MVAGGAAGMLLGIPGVSHADSAVTAGAQPTTDATTATTTAPTTPGAPGGRKAPFNTAIDNALKGLVDNKTLTQDQADAVKKALQDQLGAMAPRGPLGPGRFGFAGPLGAKADVLGTASKILNMTPADIASQLRSGKSLADIAKSKNIDPQKITDALVADATAKIDQAVKNNKLTSDQASKIKSNLQNMMSNLVNNTGPPKLRGHGFGIGGPPPGGDNGGPSGSTTTKPASYTTA